MPQGKEEKKLYREETKANSERLKLLSREAKALEKLEEEASDKREIAEKQSERQVAIIRDAASDLARICEDPKEVQRFFFIADTGEIKDNEFNLNVPRYVDTFEPEEEIPIPDALTAFDSSSREFIRKRRALRRLLRANGGAQ